jgi:hypothetical protein
MFEWTVKISVAAVLFTLVSYILPKGNIQKASLTALSFLFLAIIMLPLKNVTAELINKKFLLEAEKNQLISQIEGNSAEAEVIKYYVERISEEVKKSLSNKKFECVKIDVTVNEDMSSEDFGKVLNVICDLKVKEDKKDTLDKIKVPDIVIDKGGIRIESDDKTQKPDMTSYEKEIKEIINELTGVDINRITIRWE